MVGDCGRNRGLVDLLEERMVQLIAHQHALRGRKVSLVGWSLGGIYASNLPSLCQKKRICAWGARLRARRARLKYGSYNGRAATRRTRVCRLCAASLLEPPPVSTTAVFSKADGICAWQGCVEEVGPLAESIEVYSSHCGMGFNPLPVIVLSEYASIKMAVEPMRRGAYDFLQKPVSSADIRDRLERLRLGTSEPISAETLARPGIPMLNLRERHILALLMYGQTSKQIGQKLSVSFRTVENIRARLLKKFHAKDAESIARQLFALDRPKSPKPKER